MGPLLLCGLATFGAIVAIGIIAAAAPRPSAPVGMLAPTRRLAIILFAVASGAGIWGVVVALLGAVSGSDGGGAGAGNVTAAPLVAVVPIVGAVLAISLAMASFGGLDPWVLARSIPFIFGMIGLTAAAAVLTVVVRGPATALDALPFVALGIVDAGALVGLGFVGAASIAGVAPLESSATDDPAVRAAINRAFLRIVPFELVAIGAAAVGIVRVVQAGG